MRERSDRIIYIKKIGVGCIPLPRVCEGEKRASQSYSVLILNALYESCIKGPDNLAYVY